MSDIRVFIADADAGERRDLVHAVEEAAGLRVVGATATDDGAAAEILSADADALVVRMTTTEQAIDLCRRMLDARPSIRCLVLASAADQDAFIQAVLVGAAGAVRRERLVQALRDESDELEQEAMRLLEAHGDRGAVDVFAGLTRQQREVALLVLSGATNTEIARRLHLSTYTVRNYLSQIMTRLGTRNRTELAVGLAAALLSARREPGPRV